MDKITLKEGKERSLLRRHPWIFSGAIASFPSDASPGDVFPVHSFSGEFLAQAYLHPENSLAARVLSFDRAPLEQVIEEQIRKAYNLRRDLLGEGTNCYRLINSEGDGLPGLIVDVYGTALVLQVNSWGIEKLKTLIIQTLIKIVRPQSIYEKSLSSARLQEGLVATEGTVWGEKIDEVEVSENGILFSVSFKEGQKTGLFLDQREMRAKVRMLAKDKRVLNCFSYTGGFSLAALKGGALSVDSVDSCARASFYARKNSALNQFDPSCHKIIEQDVFQFLKSASLDYELVILDPPAFAKKRGDLDAACRGYKEINRLALEKMPESSLLVTSSCSYHVDDALFQNLLFQSAHEAKRNVKIIGRHILAPDHPISLYHPEGSYLKSLILRLV